MKFNKIKTILLAALVVTGITSCNDDDSLFKGEDHSISAFKLEKDETVLKATISDDSITIQAPENFSLQGAKAFVSISENATIDPDPSTITNWDERQKFTVSGFNGNRQIYSYSVVRTNVIGVGDIVLTTQDEVVAFAAQEISKLQGSLIIGAPQGGGDSIISLEPLSGLKIITSALTINPTFAGNSLNGLQNIEMVGSVTIGAAPNLGLVAFPGLKSIMSGLTISNTKITGLDFPVLESIDSSVTLSQNDSVVAVSFPRLKSVAGDFLLKGGWKQKAKLNSLALPLLQSVNGKFSLQFFPNLTAISIPELTDVISLDFSYGKEMETISLPKLQQVFLDAAFSDFNVLTTLDISALSSVGRSLLLQNLPLIESVEMLKSLTSVGGKFTLNLPHVTSLSPMYALTDVDEFYLACGFHSLSEELPTLKNVKKFTISASDIEEGIIKEIDVTNISGIEKLSVSNINNSFLLKGPDVFGGILNISQANAELQGFKEIERLFITGFNEASNIADKEFRIKKVMGDFTLSCSNISGTLNFPELEEVGGKLSLDGRRPVTMPHLKKVGTFNSQVAPSEGGIFEFPELVSVDGDCYICTKISWGYWEDVKMPRLKKVTGKLTVGGYSSYYKNTVMTHLDGFAALTTAGAITIQYNSNFTDYSGLRNAILSISSESWEAKGNAYNPTYQELIDGKWTPEE